MRALMRNAMLAAVVAGGLVGCASGGSLDQIGRAVSAVSQARVPADAVIVARSAFNTAQAAAANYMRLKRCTGTNGPICRDPALTQRVHAAVIQGRSARNRITALSRQSGDGSVPIADYNTLQAATAIINDVTASVRR